MILSSKWKTVDKMKMALLKHPPVKTPEGEGAVTIVFAKYGQ